MSGWEYEYERRLQGVITRRREESQKKTGGKKNATRDSNPESSANTTSRNSWIGGGRVIHYASSALQPEETSVYKML
eukprot:scaffold2971_cov274-Pinguiococcus_pyrenoidosus.AAC.5